MATSRSNVVASAAGSGTMRGASTARAHSPGRDYHYESPNEDNQPPFFSSPHQHQQHQQQGAPSTDPQDGGGLSRPLRPTRLSRASHAVSFPFPSPSPPHDNGYGLDTVMSRAEKLKSRRKIGIKDRISCYQWTYFTMVWIMYPPNRVCRLTLLRLWPQEGSPTSCIHVCQPFSRFT